MLKTKNIPYAILRFFTLFLFLFVFSQGKAFAATITVDSADDPGEYDNLCTFREAIVASNNNEDYSGCIRSGTGANIINFNLPLPATITYTSGAYVLLTRNVTIMGPGASNLTINGGDMNQVLWLYGSEGDTFTVSGVTIKGGKGGITVNSGNILNVNQSVIDGNSADFSGGGIANYGTLTMDQTTLSNNIGGFAGGGLYNDGTATITNSTINNNSSVYYGGGGIYNVGTLTLTNSTISGNSTPAGGGGIYNEGFGSTYGTVTAVNVTIANNTTTSLGGGVVNNGIFNFKNTIIAENIGSNTPDCMTYTALDSQDYNLIGNNLGCQINNQAHDLINYDAKLGALANNGDLTQTHALLSDSPAIDAATATGGPATDQRGQPRPQDGNGDGASLPDIGAYEVATVSVITLEQSAYRFYANANSTDVGTPLAALNTYATLSSNGQPFRMRMLTHIGSTQLAQNGATLKLQYAEKGGGSCASPGGSNPGTYTDVTTSTLISYYDNPIPASGVVLTSNANDPTHNSDTKINQTYNEANNFTNSQGLVPVGQDAQWDFSLYDNGAAAGTSYCFRIVKSDGTLLDTYSQYPEVITASSVAVSSVNSSTADGTYTGGGTVSIQVNFSQTVIVTGTPQLTLETGTNDAVVNYTNGSGTSTLNFTYTIASGESSSDLDYQSTTALALNSGTIKDGTGNNVILTLPSPQASGSLGANKSIVIDAVLPAVSNVTSSTENGTYGKNTSIAIQVEFNQAVNVTGIPQITLNTTPAKIVNYSSGNGTNTLTFNYTVAAGDASSDLDYASTGALALNNGTIKSATNSNNVATLTLASPGTAGSLGFNKDIVISAQVKQNVIGLQLHNLKTTPLVIKAMQISWTPSTAQVNSITIGGTSVWTGAAASGTNIDIVDTTLPAEGTVNIDSIGFDSDVQQTNFTIIFTLKDGTTKTSNFNLP